MTTVKLNIFSLIKRLEIKHGHDLQWSDISRKSGITRQTWLRLRTNEATGIDLVTIGKLLDFFAAEGMPITVNDLFTTQAIAPASIPSGAAVGEPTVTNP